MTLDNWQWRNPEHVLEQKQQREINRKAGAEMVCSGCIYKRILFIAEEKVKACSLKRGFNPTIWCDHKRTEKQE